MYSKKDEAVTSTRVRCSFRALFLLLGAGSPLWSQTRVFPIATLPPIAEVNLTLDPQRDQHLLELRNFRAEADPVINLVDASGKESARGVARAGRLVVSVPRATVGRYILVVRSRSSTPEKGDLWVDGRLLKPGLQFSAGSSIPMSGIYAGEEAVGVAPPNGARSHVAYLVSADGRDLIARDSGAHTRLRLPAGQNVQVVYGSPSSNITTPIRVYRNDVGHDTDGDGLGDALEAAIGTCPQAGGPSGCGCPGCTDPPPPPPDPRDTDGDGLWDSWELLGFSTSWQTSGGLVFGYLPLQTWGANPRHKDIFVEIDFRRLTQEDNQNNVMEKMSPMVARQMAAIYGDNATTDASLRAAHAASIQNPDSLPGISIHLDTGVPPQSPADATIYGDWGGYNAVDALPDSMGVFRPQTPGVWKDQMSAVRYGIFHYVLGYTTGGGACGQGIACGFNMASSANSAHEFGHTLGLDHNGPYGTHEPNCKPNYPSLMNYAYLGLGQFSDGRKFPTLNNHALAETGAIDPADGGLLRTLQLTWGYKVDSATGSVDWNRDNRFAPAGTTVRAYGNYQPGSGGGCEFTREGEQATGMMSQRSPAIVRYNDHLWLFSVTLDGKLAYSYMGGAFLCAKIDDCPLVSFYSPVVKDLEGIDGIDAAVIKVNGRRIILIVGIRPDGTLFETWVEDIGGFFVWGSTLPIPGSPAAGEPSLAVSGAGSTVVLAYRGRDNVVRYRFRNPGSFRAEQTMNVGTRPLVMSANGSPSMAFTYLPGELIVGREQLVSAVIDTTETVQLYAPAFPGHGWLRLGIPYGFMSPAMGRPAMAWVGPTPTNTMVEASGASGTMATARSPAHARPVRSTPPRHGGAAGGLLTPDPVTYGRFYILYIENDPPVEGATNPDPVRMEMSYVDATGRLRIGLDSYFDNVWSYAFGTDLLQPGEIALRAAQSYSIPNAGSHPNSLHQVQVRPHADGISNLPYKNYDDWKVIGWGSCAILQAVQTPAMQSICPPKSW